MHEHSRNSKLGSSAGYVVAALAASALAAVALRWDLRWRGPGPDGVGVGRPPPSVAWPTHVSDDSDGQPAAHPLREEGTERDMHGYPDVLASLLFYVGLASDSDSLGLSV